MNTTDKNTDEWFRQALQQPGNAPVPGSPFDAERLWKQLHPQLPAAAVSTTNRRTKLAWLAAAALAALWFGGWWWLMPLQSGESVAVQKPVVRPLAQTARPAPIRSAARLPKGAAVAERMVVPVKAKKDPVVNVVLEQSEIAQQATPEARNVQPANPALAARTVPEMAQEAIANVPNEALRPVTRPQRLKQRFAVVHVNELRAEAETQAKLERNDQFVRLGIGPFNSPAPPDQKAALIIPLN